MSEQEIQISREGNVIGAYTLEGLVEAVQTGLVSVTDHAWAEGMESWVSVPDFLTSVGANIEITPPQIPSNQPISPTVPEVPVGAAAPRTVAFAPVATRSRGHGKRALAPALQKKKGLSVGDIVIALLCFAAGAFFLYTYFADEREVDEIVARGKVVTGDIVDGLWTVGRKGRNTIVLEVAYDTESGEVSHDFKVGADVWHAKQGLRNPKCQVKYLPEDPTKALFLGSPPENKSTLLLGAVLAGLGVLVLVLRLIAVSR